MKIKVIFRSEINGIVMTREAEAEIKDPPIYMGDPRIDHGKAADVPVDYEGEQIEKTAVRLFASIIKAAKLT